MSFNVAWIRRVGLSCSLAAVAGVAAAQTPSPALVVDTRGAGAHTLTIIDPSIDKVVASVPISGAGMPHEVAVSADGKLAYVTDTGFDDADPTDNPDGTPASFISVVDLVAQKELGHIQTGPGSFPHGIVFAGGKLYFTAEGYKLVARYDPLNNQIDWMLGTAQNRQHMLVVSKDLHKLFTANSGSNTVTAIEYRSDIRLKSGGSKARTSSESGKPLPPAHFFGEPYDRWNATQIPVGKMPEGIAISPDEKEVWVLTREDGGLSIIDYSTDRVLQTVDLKMKVPLRIQFTPDGRRVVIVSGEDGDILILDAATRKEIKRLRLPSEQTDAELKALEDQGKGDKSLTMMHGLLVAPDGLHAYATAINGNYIAVIDLKTLELSGRIPTASRPESLAWAQTR